jgi:L-2-hydroxyglutarate oxidase
MERFIVKQYDCAIIGGGLVGLAAAYQILLSHPGRKIVVLEKEQALATHQSTRNSGVMHTGVYYKPGSYKSQLCTEGRLALLDFVKEHNVAHSLCGKLIVATHAGEVERLENLYKRAVENGVKLELLSAEALKEREPHVAGVKGLWVPGAGVVDFEGVALALKKEIIQRGGEIVLGATLTSAVSEGIAWVLEGSFDTMKAGFVINCAGLFSDRVARMFGASPPGEIVPFRGEYYLLRDEARSLCRALIYPVPDPRFPFLGVHFTRRFDGSVECGPNAVLAFAREGYSWGKVNLADTFSMVSFSGFRKLIARHWKMGCGEIHRSLSKAAFVRALQRLVPEVREADLLPASAGVRAQVVRRDGSLEEDFSFLESPNALHVLNAPSPAATSCLAIARVIASKVTPN